jgi:CarD family transcriptional regulator
MSLKLSKGDKIVHPVYGAGTIDDITEEESCDGRKKDYFIIKTVLDELVVRLPVDVIDSVHVRKVYEMNDLMTQISNAPRISQTSGENWTTKHREDVKKVVSGDVGEVASVVKCLVHKEKGRALSATEKKTLHSAKQIILSEIILSCGVQRLEAEDILQRLIN